jgi:hypothetical protein
MKPVHQAKVESQAPGELAAILPRVARDPARRLSGSRLNLDPENVTPGLIQLVLTLIKLLHELLERQSLRRLEAGSLTDAEIERLALTLMSQAQEIDRLRQEFGLEEADLNLDLGPLGRLG